jgi:hypothetical protein
MYGGVGLSLREEVGRGVVLLEFITKHHFPHHFLFIVFDRRAASLSSDGQAAVEFVGWAFGVSVFEPGAIQAADDLFGLSL